jgi:tetratricopeptide (TPR) repeat protein
MDGAASREQLEAMIHAEENSGKRPGELFVMAGLLSPVRYRKLWVQGEAYATQVREAKKKRVPLLLGAGGCIVLILLVLVFLFLAGREARLHYRKALEYEKQGKLVEAEAELEKALRAAHGDMRLRISEKLANVVFRRCKQLKKRGEIEKAIAEWEKILHRFAESDWQYRKAAELLAESRLALGRKAALQKRYEEALAHWKQILEIDILVRERHRDYVAATENMAKTYYRLGLSRYRRDKILEAIDSWERVAGLVPEDNPYRMKAKAALLYVEALSRFEQAELSEARSDIAAFFRIPLPKEEFEKTEFYSKALELKKKLDQ